MMLASEQIKTNGRKCLGFGPPKGAGKSTFYLTMPQPLLDLQFDLGSVTVPPGVDVNGIWIQDYPDIESVDLSTATLKRKRENGDKVAKDLVALLDSFKGGKDVIKLSDGTSCPRPRSLLLDGGTRMDEIIIDLLCAIQGISDPTDAISKNGGSGTMCFYSDRLNRIRKLFTMVISLPINVAMTTWEDIIIKKDIKGNEISRTIEPDLGGKLNILGPGMFDSCLYHYYATSKYLVRTKPTPECGRLGVRGQYDLEPIIDVTLAEGKPLPYTRVFGE